MFDALGSKVFSTVVALSMLLFSSFKGNDPAISQFQLSKTDSYLYVKAQLSTAFENDFPSIFASGVPVNIHYDLDLRGANGYHGKRRVTNRISYDLATGIYEIRKEGLPSIYSKSISEVLHEAAHLEVAIPYNREWGELKVKLSASLPKVYFKELGKQMDLMVLWKYKKPGASGSIDLRRLD
ncbi:MAG: hypothetical protein PHC50_06125 [Candidatus Cloacimonetes bacterium]|nr:hypothetical protein [Candidatus Cloacimonadota bacterium]